MTNLFLDTIWKNYWKDNCRRHDNTSNTLDMIIKQAIGKSPFYKLKENDRLKIEDIYIFFHSNTLVRFNNISEFVVMKGTDISCFTPFQAVKHFCIAYFSTTKDIFYEDELELESEIYQSNLFYCFPKLESINLVEHTKDGTREINIKREAM